jgi:hypothetical protein
MLHFTARKFVNQYVLCVVTRLLYLISWGSISFIALLDSLLSPLNYVMFKFCLIEDWQMW